MSDKSKIEWTDATWNPVTGCTRVSEGCRNCYMARTVPRFGQDPWTVKLHPDRLDQPLKWKRPRRIFVNSLSDVFHSDIPREFIKAIVGVTMDCPQHIFQILTKRPQRMLEFCRDCEFPSNVWLGVSIEDQATADERLPLLLQTPAAVRFVSYEPAIGPVNLRYVNPYDDFHNPSCRLNWCIAGGESGPGARPAHPSWFRSIRDQCQGAGVPFFFKQWGEWRPETLAELADTKNTEKSLQIRESGERLPCGQGAVYRDGVIMRRVGKQAAGAQLDGREWREFPQFERGPHE